MSVEDEPMRVTLRDVYTAVQSLSSDVGDMKNSLDLQTLAASQDHDRVVDHEARIRFLERWAWSIPAAFIAAVGSLLTAFLK